MAGTSFEHAQLTGKVAVITGGAQGIGEAVARLFAARGVAGLFLVDRNGDKARAVAAALTASGTPAEGFTADLADMAQVEAVIPAAEKRFGRIDVLVNCAGLTDRGTIWDTTPELWDRMFAINVRAHGGTSFLTPYSSSKAALAILTKNVAHSVSNRRIKVNGLNLGWVDTPGEHTTLKRFHNAPEDWLETAEAGRPWGRLMKPDEVARAVAFLATEESGLMTGSVIDFDQVVIGPNEAVGPRKA